MDKQTATGVIWSDSIRPVESLSLIFGNWHIPGYRDIKDRIIFDSDMSHWLYMSHISFCGKRKTEKRNKSVTVAEVKEYAKR